MVPVPDIYPLSFYFFMSDLLHPENRYWLRDSTKNVRNFSMKMAQPYQTVRFHHFHRKLFDLFRLGPRTNPGSRAVLTETRPGS